MKKSLIFTFVLLSPLFFANYAFAGSTICTATLADCTSNGCAGLQSIDTNCDCGADVASCTTQLGNYCTYDVGGDPVTFPCSSTVSCICTASGGGGGSCTIITDACYGQPTCCSSGGGTNGACGNLIYAPGGTPQSGGLSYCNAGTAVNFTGPPTSQWTCAGSNGGSNATCIPGQPIPAPTGLTVTAGACGTNTLTISWNLIPNSVAFVGAYKLYRDGGLLSNGTNPPYVDSGLAAGSTHSYTVIAINPWQAGGGTATMSAPVSGSVAGACACTPGTISAPASVNTNTTFAATVDYGVQRCTSAPAGCTWTGFAPYNTDPTFHNGWVGTAAEFACTSPGVAGTMALNFVPCDPGAASYCAVGVDVSVTATCPAGSVSLSSNPITVGNTSTASAPAGFTGGTFSSSNAGIASVSGSTVTGASAGSANITGNSWSYSNGATNCSLGAASLTVNPIPKSHIVLNPPSLTFSGVSGGSAPVGQTLTIQNTGTATLNWTATTPYAGKAGTWCHISAASGSIAVGSSQNVTVTVDSPSNTGSISDCGIRFTDANADNSPQDETITYNVSPSNPGSVTVAATVCPAVPGAVLNWTAAQSGSVGKTYNIYRNTVNNSGTASLVGNTASLTYTDNPATGATYYYWVETSSGGFTSSRTAPTPASLAVNACAGAPAISLSKAVISFAGVSGSTTPASTSFTVTNNGSVGSTLKWHATTNMNWCFVLGVGNGTYASPSADLAQGAISPAQTVSVGAPSNAGSFGCIITVSDNGSSPVATNTPRTITVNYGVRPSVPGNVTASATVCPAVPGVVLNWTAAQSGTTAKTYNIYRNTVNNSGTATLVGNTSLLTFTNNPATGSTYYYWVETLSGGQVSQVRSPTVPASMAVNTCPPPTPTAPSAVVTDNSACGSVVIQWNDNSNNETGFHLYKDGVLWQTLGANVTTYNYAIGADTSPHLYSVSAYNAGGDSAQASAGGNVAGFTCSAHLNTSDKEITAVNGGALLHNDCNSASAILPSYITPKLGDLISYSVNLCNTSNLSSEAASQIYVTDAFTNLVLASSTPVCYVDTGQNCQLSDEIVPMSPVTSCPPALGSYCLSGTAPNQTIILNLKRAGDNIAISRSKSITYKAYLGVPAGYTGSRGYFMNSVHVDYFNGLIADALDFFMPLQMFLVGQSVPIIIEKP